MKFYAKKPLRFFYRYALIGILIGLPLYMAVLLASVKELVTENDRPYMVATCLVLACIGAVFMHFGFSEKCFATLHFSDDSVCWRAPLRRKCVISLLDCKFAGVENEDSHNGRPYPYIYISPAPYPIAYKNKINKLKCSNNFIKFWYSDELCKYLEEHLPKGCAGSLTAYRIYRKHKPVDK